MYAKGIDAKNKANENIEKLRTEIFNSKAKDFTFKPKISKESINLLRKSNPKFDRKMKDKGKNSMEAKINMEFKAANDQEMNKLLDLSSKRLYSTINSKTTKSIQSDSSLFDLERKPIIISQCSPTRKISTPLNPIFMLPSDYSFSEKYKS